MYVGDTADDTTGAATGVVRVEDLLRSPALQLRLIAGAAGVARRVAWAHVSELAGRRAAGARGDPPGRRRQL